MKRLMPFTAALLALTFVLAATSATRAGNDEVSLDEVNLGTHVYGPEVDADALAGKVVVFEYWGDRCGPCIRSIPHLVKVQKKYGNDKLQIVANQVWTKDIEKAKRAWTNAGGSEDIAVVNHGALQGAAVRGVPHSFVFDHTGKLLWHGHPASKDLEKTIEKAVKALPDEAKG